MKDKNVFYFISDGKLSSTACSGERSPFFRLREPSCGFLKLHISSRNLLDSFGSWGAQPRSSRAGFQPGWIWAPLVQTNPEGSPGVLRVGVIVKHFSEGLDGAASRFVSTPELFILSFPGKPPDPRGRSVYNNQNRTQRH